MKKTIALAISLVAALSGSLLAQQRQSKSTVDQIGEFVVEAYADSAGNLWFGTMSKGVARFDGNELRYFSTPDGLLENTICSVIEDAEGNIWFGSHKGVTRYDGIEFKSFGPREGVSGPGCQFLVTTTGDLFVGSNRGLFRFDGERFETVRIPKPQIENIDYKWEAGKVWCMLEDSQGKIWIGRDGYGITVMENGNFEHITKTDGLLSNNVSQIVEDHEGRFWIGCLTSDWPEPNKSGGLCLLDGGVIRQFAAVDGLTENDVYTIFQDLTDRVWVGAPGHGVYRFDGLKPTLFEKTDREDLLQNFGLQSVVQGMDGELWFGFSGGLFRFDGEKFLNVKKDGPWN